MHVLEIEELEKEHIYFVINSWQICLPKKHKNLQKSLERAHIHHSHKGMMKNKMKRVTV